jgi:hypothetical protein
VLYTFPCWEIKKNLAEAKKELLLLACMVEKEKKDYPLLGCDYKPSKDLCMASVDAISN